MTEKEFSHKVCEQLRQEGVDVQRVENGVGAGIPDINMCYQGREIWTELKLVLKNGILLRKEQYAWGMRRNRVGGRVFVVALALDGSSVYGYKYPFSIHPMVGNKYVRIDDDPLITMTGTQLLRTFLFPID